MSFEIHHGRSGFKAFENPLEFACQVYTIQSQKRSEEIVYTSFDISKGATILDCLIASELLHELVCEANEYRLKVTGPWVNQLRNRIVGRLFQSTAYTYLAGSIFPENAVLSSGSTLAFFYQLFKNGGQNPQLVTSPFHLEGIRGKNIPDNLVLDLANEGKISHVCEATLSGSEKKHFNFMNGLNMLKIKYPLFRNAKPLVVAPRFASIKSVVGPQVSVIELPFSHNEFRLAIDSALKDTYLSQ